MPKNKIRSYKREDAFRAYTGELVTRKQLGDAISKLNRKFRNPKYLMKYMSIGEFNQAQKFYLELSRNVYGKEKPFSIRGVHDVTDLKQIEQAVRRLSESFYYDKSAYDEAKKKQFTSLKTTFSGISEDRLKHIYEVFKTDIWHHLIENELLKSEQVVSLIDDYGGLDEDKIEDVVRILEHVEGEAERTGKSLDKTLREMLISYRDTIW